MGPDGPKWAQEDFFPTNPDLADILGRTDFDFENFYFLDLFGVPNFWLGPTWAQLGPTHLGPAWARLGPTHLGPAWAHPLGPGMGPPTWASLGPPTWAPRVGRGAPRVGSGGPSGGLGWARVDTKHILL